MPAFAVRISWSCWLANTSTARQIREHRENLAIAAEVDWDGNGVQGASYWMIFKPMTSRD